jgi:1,4-alpha-glucan branching enzyme
MEVLDVPPAIEAHFLSPEDLYLFNEGTHLCLHNKLGAHLCQEPNGAFGVHFAVWAPNAEEVHVIGDFSGWDKSANALQPQGSSGIWTGFIPRLQKGACYKYHILGQGGQYRVDKADPVGFLQEPSPKTGSLVWDLDYHWGDGDWMHRRGQAFQLGAPVAIYEVHLGSWMRNPEQPDQWLGYRELAPLLADHVQRVGFTHVEFLPVMEHPFYGSWGYQTTGYFAPTSRYGSPQDLMFLIDQLHQRGIGVILDWVPSHFPADEHGLAYFDGTHLYEHGDPRQGRHPDWNSDIFNCGRHEVRSFLLSSAFFWLDRYHADGLRLDAVASMLYLDYSRKPGAWIPNKFGGRENLEAISFLRQLNVEVYQHFPKVQTIAEESTAWPMVSRPTYVGGLGFGFKWDMGFMHDTLGYFLQDPLFRKYHHNELTFRAMYAFTENFALPFSHDEVVYGKGSLLSKMPGDDWQKFANLRLLFGYMYLQPGKKLLFMGGEFGQRREWNHDASLDWHLQKEPAHAGVQLWVGDLNQAYRREAALHQTDCVPNGFEWVDCRDADQSTLSWLRRGTDSEDVLLIVCNFTPMVRRNYRVGVPIGGHWHELLNSDAQVYGGSGQGNFGGIDSVPYASHGRPETLIITLPPLAITCFKLKARSPSD